MSQASNLQEILCSSPQNHQIGTPNGPELATPPDDAPFKVKSGDVSESADSEIDLGDPAVWRRYEGAEYMVLPSSSQELIIAESKHKVPNPSSKRCRSRRSVRPSPEKLHPIIQGPYEISWVEGCFLEGRVTKDELQSFCEDAYNYCSRTVSAWKCMRVIKKIGHGLLISSILLIIAGFLKSLLFPIGAGLLLVFIAVVVWIEFKLANFPKLLQRKLAEFIHKEKQELLKKGVKSRPGAGGVFIEFLPA